MRGTAIVSEEGVHLPPFFLHILVFSFDDVTVGTTLIQKATLNEGVD